MKFVGEDDPLALRIGKIYTARVLKKGWFGVVDKTHEELPIHLRFLKLSRQKMVNIWEYVFAFAVRIVTVRGNINEGAVVCVDDVEDLYDTDKDETTIKTADGKFIGFKQSEILEITKLSSGGKYHV